jgi:hypothetical protein
MGTNYHLRYNDCDGCGRYDEAHIGKQSAGWSFLFRAYGGPHADESPFGFDVRSRADWRRVLETVKGRVVDEYDREVDEPLVWLDGHRPPDGAQRAFEETPGFYPSYYDRTEWRDTEGFRFEPREFS